VSLRTPAHDAGSGLAGEALGQCQYGSSFVLDVFDAYRTGLVSNPNVIVAGSIGAGKSTIVKMQLERALRRGRRAVVVDPKG
jgi:type IV secretory pathway VirB4 component